MCVCVGGGHWDVGEFFFSPSILEAERHPGMKCQIPRAVDEWIVWIRKARVQSDVLNHECSV